MDKRQKSTLRSQHIKIADELILDEDFYAALRRDKIFTNGMLDLIKVNRKVPKTHFQGLITQAAGWRLLIIFTSICFKYASL
jgi:hypothetical protein